jgi:tryptophanase
MVLYGLEMMLREYICSLQDKIRELEREKKEKAIARKDVNSFIETIMKTDIMKDWLREHDSKEYRMYHQDWSGLQNGA